MARGAACWAGRWPPSAAKPVARPAVPPHPFEAPAALSRLPRARWRATPARPCAAPAAATRAPNEGGVYNLLRSADRAELYPGERADIIDFSLPGHERRLLGGWHEVEGVFGNKYRWIGPSAEARLRPGKTGSPAHPYSRLRLRRPCPRPHRRSGERHRSVGRWTLDRPGLFVVEADVPDAPQYDVRHR